MTGTKQFGIATLLATIAGAALVFTLLRVSGDRASALLISCWGAGTSVGVVVSARYSKSIVLGSLVGGLVGTLIGLPVGQVVFLNGRVSDIPVAVALMLAGFAMCGSAAFAALVGIVQGGITVGRKPVGRQHEQSS